MARRMVTWIAIAALLTTVALAGLAGPATAAPTVELMVLGETHGTKSMTRTLVGIAQDKGATGCVCPGDFIYGDSAAAPSGWRSMMQPFMGNMMPAQGNHDWPWSDWSGMFPNGARYYDRDVGGVHFVALNTEYSLASGSSQREWLEDTLAERDASALKVVFMHRPWWLPDGARHESTEFESKNGASASSMDALMVRHGVDLVVSAHEKNYQHSFRNGVHYLVAGGGGPSFYPMGYELPGAQKRLLANAVSTLEISASSMTLKSYGLDGNKIEEFTMGGSAPAPSTPTGGSGDAAFTPKGGNEWWVQVAVAGAATSVAARDTDGAWVPLAKKSWGDWAASHPLVARDGLLVLEREWRELGAHEIEVVSEEARLAQGTRPPVHMLVVPPDEADVYGIGERDVAWGLLAVPALLAAALLARRVTKGPP